MSSKALSGLFLAFFLTGCGNSVHKWEGETMGTRYRITLVKARLSSAELEAIKMETAALLRRLDRELLSTYAPESEISRFNRHKSLKPFNISSETFMAARAAMELARETGGAFDPTVGPLVNLWGFGPGRRREAPPTPEEIARARRISGYKKLKILSDPPRLLKTHPELELNLNAVGEGFAADTVAEMLKGRGLGNFFIEIGGDVLASGRGPKGAWRVGIQVPDPQKVRGESLQRITLIENEGLGTSGNYRNFFETKGRRYSHILDARTGEPVRHNLASVSVIAATSMEADGAATAAMTMGPDKAEKWILSKGWRALFILGKPGGSFEERALGKF